MRVRVQTLSAAAQRAAYAYDSMPTTDLATTRSRTLLNSQIWPWWAARAGLKIWPVAACDVVVAWCLVETDE